MQFNNEKFPPVRGLYFFCDTCDTPLTYWVSRFILPLCSLWKQKKKMDTEMISIPVSIFFKEVVLYSKRVTIRPQLVSAHDATASNLFTSTRNQVSIRHQYSLQYIRIDFKALFQRFVIIYISESVDRLRIRLNAF